MVHHLKTLADYFALVLRGEKTFELRKDDRDFAVGDCLRLDEFSPEEGYTGRWIEAHVTHILRDFTGLEPGYAVLSISVKELGDNAYIKGNGNARAAQ